MLFTEAADALPAATATISIDSMIPVERIIC